MNSYWTNMKMYLICQQLLALINIYLMSSHSYCISMLLIDHYALRFVPKIALVGVILASFGIVFVCATL